MNIPRGFSLYFCWVTGWWQAAVLLWVDLGVLIQQLSHRPLAVASHSAVMLLLKIQVSHQHKGTGTHKKLWLLNLNGRRVIFFFKGSRSGFHFLFLEANFSVCRRLFNKKASIIVYIIPLFFLVLLASFKKGRTYWKLLYNLSVAEVTDKGAALTNGTVNA